MNKKSYQSTYIKEGKRERERKSIQKAPTSVFLKRKKTISCIFETKVELKKEKLK